MADRSSRRAASSPTPVTADQVAGFRLARHHLLRRAPKRRLVHVAGEVGGLQAQLLPAAQQSLAARVSDLEVADLDRAIEPGRRLARAWCMRRTVYLVPADHLAEFVRGTAMRAEREVRWMLGRGFAPERVEAIIAAGLAALDVPRTRTELAGEVGRRLGLAPRSWKGEGWGGRREVPGVALGKLTLPMGYLLHLIGARGVVLHGPSRGGQATYVRGDAWIPGFRDVPPDEAERRLLERYLRAFGPATVDEFAWWTGMRKRDATRVWDSFSDRIAPVSLGGQVGGVLREDLSEMTRASAHEAPPRLLPYFDTLLLGHPSRGHLLDAGHHPRVFRPQGWVAPAVLVGGRVAGVWSQERANGRLAIQVTPFGPLGASVERALRTEAEELGRFLGIPSVRVGFRTPRRDRRSAD